MTVISCGGRAVGMAWRGKQKNENSNNTGYNDFKSYTNNMNDWERR
jgi:hypothetical protein